MPSLADTQAAFVDALRRPDLPVPDVVARRNGRPAVRRFNVYRNNVAVGMIDAMKATYPAVARLVGDDFFRAAARVYLDRNPPQSPLLFRYGQSFGAFLDGFEPAASVPYLGDVARLEWARLQAYHAPDREPLEIAALAGFLGDGHVDVGRLRLTLHPSLMLIASPWPVVSLWAASTDQGSSADVDMKAAERALIVRPSLAVKTSRLPEGGYVFMSALAGNATLAQAADKAAETDAGFDLSSHLQGLFAVGAVVAITDDRQEQKDQVQ